MTPNSCLVTRRKILIAIGIALLLILGELSFVEFLATQDQKNVIAIYHIDKIFHVIGGAFFVLLGKLVFPRASWKTILFLAGLGVIAWEIYEVLFDADVNWFFYHRRSIWRNDTMIDLVADGVGMASAWVALRKGSIEKEQVI